MWINCFLCVHSSRMNCVFCKVMPNDLSSCPAIPAASFPVDGSIHVLG